MTLAMSKKPIKQTTTKRKFDGFTEGNPKLGKLTLVEASLNLNRRTGSIWSTAKAAATLLINARS